MAGFPQSCKILENKQDCLSIPNGWRNAKKSKKALGGVKAEMEEGKTTTTTTKWASPPHSCPLLKSGWVGTATPRSHFSPPELHQPYSCHSWFVQGCVLHVISQPILEHECMGSNVNGSVHLTHPSALHQTPSMKPPCILRQPTQPTGMGV